MAAKVRGPKLRVGGVCGMVRMASLIIRPRARIFHGHDWVYQTEIERTIGDPEPGTVVTLKDRRQRPLGTAIYNPQSVICARRISRRRESLDLDFFARRLRRARNLRESLGIDLSLCRLVWSEADGLPGVVIDLYGPHAVIQTNTLAMDLARETIASALASEIGVKTVIERNDSPSRKSEGLPMRSGLLIGSDPGPVAIRPGGIEYHLNLLDGQKTGFYLDQVDNFEVVANLAKGARVLDCFCNQGGFALACAKAGAASVHGIDISTEAIEAARANATRNGLQATFEVANAFDTLRTLADSGEHRYDLIILDPPPFARARKNANEALRGYKEIHLRALKILAPGGILATYCCSHHITAEEYLAMAVDAAVDAKKTLRLAARHSQRADHPILPSIPETEYLKGFLFQSIAAW